MNTPTRRRFPKEVAIAGWLTQAEVDQARNSPEMIRHHEETMEFFQGMDWNELFKKAEALEQTMRKERSQAKRGK